MKKKDAYDLGLEEAARICECYKEHTPDELLADFLDHAVGGDNWWRDYCAGIEDGLLEAARADEEEEDTP